MGCRVTLHKWWVLLQRRPMTGVTNRLYAMLVSRRLDANFCRRSVGTLPPTPFLYASIGVGFLPPLCRRVGESFREWGPASFDQPNHSPGRVLFLGRENHSAQGDLRNAINRIIRRAVRHLASAKTLLEDVALDSGQQFHSAFTPGAAISFSTPPSARPRCAC